MVSKYFSKKITIDGITFDSKKEYRRWCELCLLERAGKVTDLKRQVKFQLLPSQWEEYERYSEKTGKRLKNGRRCVEREVVYLADFAYKDKNGNLVVEDVKSPATKTEAYVLKRKMLLYLRGIKIHEV